MTEINLMTVELIAMRLETIKLQRREIIKKLKKRLNPQK